MFMSYVIYLYAFKKNKLICSCLFCDAFFILVGIFTAVLFKTQKEQIFGEGEMRNGWKNGKQKEKRKSL